VQDPGETPEVRRTGPAKRRKPPEPVDVGHGHGHGHGPAEPASPAVRKVLIALLVPFVLAALIGTIVLFPTKDIPAKGGSGTPVNGTITSASSGACSSGGVHVGNAPPPSGDGQCLNADIHLTDGPAAGTSITKVVPIEPSTPRFAAGDNVVLAYSGASVSSPDSYQVMDFQRDTPLVVLALLFAGAVLVLGRWQGLAALGALALSFLVIVFFILPAILAGESPLAVGVVGAAVIMFVVLYLTHGLTARTSTAVLGTMISLTLIGVLGTLFAGLAKLTGLDDETSTLVGTLGTQIDTRGLLLAGVVIGALGILDDVTVTQTSAVWELRRANPALGWRALYAAGLRIGRDHVASAVNTLVMAYAGAALPLLLYSSLSGVGFGTIMTSQNVASEVVRTLVGSIGLIAAVPITTAIAAAVAVREPARAPDVEHA
jgi:uncharacterized membrane protein